MANSAIIEDLEQEQLKKEVPAFNVGDTIKVSLRIVEGEKERVQLFQGTVIARKGKGLSETFSVHRVSYGEGMERVFYLHSPRIVNIEVIKHGDVRRAKLYYLRGTSGKASKVLEKIAPKKKKAKSIGAADTKNSKQTQAQDNYIAEQVTTDNDIELTTAETVAHRAEGSFKE